MAIAAEDFDTQFLASSVALCISGTHLSQPQSYAVCVAAMRGARAVGTRVALDIDYRPVLWGLTSPGLGEQRYVQSGDVSAHLQTVIPECDLVVGTEEEIHIAGGSTNTIEALERLRELTPGTLVVKRGPMGCVAFAGAIPDRIDDGLKGPGFPVEVFNILGAGDAFMAGFLRGWIRDEPLERCCAYANACGALVVSRHGCAPAMPSWTELSAFLEHGSPTRRLREDVRLERVAPQHDAYAPLGRFGGARVRPSDPVPRHGCASAGAATGRIVACKRLIAEGRDSAQTDCSVPGSFSMTAMARRSFPRSPVAGGGSRDQSSCRVPDPWRSKPATRSPHTCAPGPASTWPKCLVHFTPTIHGNCGSSNSSACANCRPPASQRSTNFWSR